MIVPFFNIVPQWGYLCNQFGYTFEKESTFMAAFAAGCSWSIFASMLRKSEMNFYWMIADIILIIIALGV